MMSKKELALVFEQLEKEHRFSGTVLVSRDGEVVFEKAYGSASRQPAL
jgi:CubicO group peptidase (beta-lactamase class C family)